MGAFHFGGEFAGQGWETLGKGDRDSVIATSLSPFPGIPAPELTCTQFEKKASFSREFSRKDYI